MTGATSWALQRQLAEQIREDRIDILVDLALHTANNRLLVFARKARSRAVTLPVIPPARVDRDRLPPERSLPGPAGMDESVYTSRRFALPHSFWCTIRSPAGKSLSILCRPG